VPWNHPKGHAVGTRVGHQRTEDLAHERVRHLDQQSSAVTRIDVRSGSAAVFEVLQDR